MITRTGVTVILLTAVSLIAYSRAKAAADEISIRRGTTVDRLTMAPTERAPTEVLFREVHITFTVSSGRRINGELLIALDIDSHQFWWILRNDGDTEPTLAAADWFVSHSGIFIDRAKVVVFWNPWPGQIFVLERRGLLANNLDDAQQQALAAIQQHPDEFGPGGTRFGLLRAEISLPQLRIPSEFWREKYQSAPVMERTKIVSVSKEGSQWRLVLRDHWDQEVILDDTYKFVDTRRLPDSSAKESK